MSAARPPADHDVVVVGSGFGGSVAALRLAEKGYDVLVLEAGRRFADADLARTSWQLPRYLWAPRMGCYGVQRIHRLPHVMVLAGAGVGGGSLNYGCTLYVPPRPFFTDPQWAGITDWQAELAPHYDVAQAMLGVVTNPCRGPVEEVMEQAARDLGVGDTFRRTPVGVFFGPAGQEVPDPYFGGAGPARTGCTQCGNCMVGCRVGAKNTLVKNYLALAEGLGVTVEPMRTVVRVGLVPGPAGSGEDGEPGRAEDADAGSAVYRVLTERTGPCHGRDRRVVTARHVVLAAGTWGTQELLHAMRAEGELPRLSGRLGELTRTNSEALLGALAERVPPGTDLTRGVAITTSFHPEPGTHVENVRYGRGSNVMGALATLLVDEGRLPRPLRFLGQLLADPRPLLRVEPTTRRFSERAVIGLVMQTRDNSITVSARRRWGRWGRSGRWRLTSAQGHGEPNPTSIPAGHRAVRAIARRLAERTGVPVHPGGTWGELFGVPLTAHFLGGAVIGDSPASGVLDPYHRVWGHPGLHVVDGSAVSANLGVNPSLTITAQAERAFALWPVRGEPDPRPRQGEGYARLDQVPARRPAVPGPVGPAA